MNNIYRIITSSYIRFSSNSKPESFGPKSHAFPQEVHSGLFLLTLRLLDQSGPSPSLQHINCHCTEHICLTEIVFWLDEIYSFKLTPYLLQKISSLLRKMYIRIHINILANASYVTGGPEIPRNG